MNVKSIDAHLIRTLLISRSRLVEVRTKLSNQLRGILKTFGLMVGKTSGGAFEIRVRDQQILAHARASVGAYLGLTPKRYQSGEVDKPGRISNCDGSLMRIHLYEAASVILTRVRKWSSLKAWG